MSRGRHFSQVGRGGVRGVDDPQSCRVVGLVADSALHVLVVVDGGGGPVEDPVHPGIVQVGDVPDPGLGVVSEVVAVELVVQQEVAQVLKQEGDRPTGQSSGSLDRSVPPKGDFCPWPTGQGFS